MRSMRRLLPAAAFVLAGCASVPPPSAASAPPVLGGSAAVGLHELRVELEHTHDSLFVHEQKPVGAPEVDFEAASSIPMPEHRTIRSAIDLFSGEMHEDIQASLLRSARYKKMIDAALHQYRLPKGLAYLPVIESAYMPRLTSRAGAHGMWQFMPDTAREYGLRVDWWVDERADPEKSTEAAAAYLNDLYRDFNDWPLVLAAYNAGAGRIHRAMDAVGARSFWELLDADAVPRETRGYVPTFFATLLIASDPQTYGFHLSDPDDARGQKQIEIDGPVSLAYVAEVGGISRDVLKEMNPALRRGFVPPGRVSVHVPATAAPLLSARARTLKNEDADIALCTFTLRDGDTLKKLARTLGVSIDTLMSMNALRSAKSVSEGDSIYVPVRARDLGTLLHGAYYTVRKGDTVYSIAKKHGLSVDDLRELNDLAKHAKLHPGQRLRVHGSRPVTAGN